MLQADFTISKAVKMPLRVKGSKYLDYQDPMKCLLTNFRESKNSYANQANWEKPKEVKKIFRKIPVKTVCMRNFSPSYMTNLMEMNHTGLNYTTASFCTACKVIHSCLFRETLT